MIDETQCYAVRCGKPHTHVLTTKILAKPPLGEMTMTYNYCLEHAIYFAGWLPYCYPGEYEVVSITPPASEMFSK